MSANNHGKATLITGKPCIKPGMLTNNPVKAIPNAGKVAVSAGKHAINPGMLNINAGKQIP